MIMIEARDMRKGNRLVSILITLVFITGMVAPVPECYVTRLVCPARANNACHGLADNTADGLSQYVSCCQITRDHLPTESPSSCPDLGRKVKSYVPDLVSVEVPITPVALPALHFQAPLLVDTPYIVRYDALRHVRPDPIPILLKKQSLLI